MTDASVFAYGPGNTPNFGITGVDGAYRITVVPGSYKVQFMAPANSTLVSQWWNNKPDPFSADAITAIAGQVAAGTDAVLKVGTPGA